VKFCGKCGAEITGTQKVDDSKADVKETISSVTNMIKVMPLKKLLKFAIPAVLIILAMIIVLPMLRGANISIAKDSISFFADGDSVIVSGNNNTKFTISGEMRSSQISMDGSKAVLLTDFVSGSGGTLWLVTTSNSTRIAEDVLAYQIADSGNGVVYFTDFDSRNSTAALYLYDTSSRRTTLISDEAMFEGREMVGVCISPDGKSVGFIGDVDNSSNELTGYIRVDGKSTERLGNNMFALAISNGGRHIYYVRMTEDGRRASLHVRSGRNENRLIPDMSSWGVSMLLNRDYSEVLFSVEDRTFISRNGGERTRVSGSAINGLLLPQGGQMRYTHGNMGGIIVYGVRSFANTLAVTSGGIELINNKFEADRVPGSNSIRGQAFVSDDGRNLLFITGNGNLVRVDTNRLDAERNEIERGVRSFVASNDGRTVFFVNSDEELWHVRGNGRPSKVSDFVSSERIVMSNNSNRVFFLVDYIHRNGGELHFSDNGRRSTKIADDVMSVWSTRTNIFYTNFDSELFRSNGNERFSPFHDNVRR
jgi:hypothetical protein